MSSGENLWVRQAGRWQVMVVAIAAAILVSVGVAVASAAATVDPHPPVSTSRAEVLPDPPFDLGTLDQDLAQAQGQQGIFTSHLMTGSPDRLVVTDVPGTSGYGSDMVRPPVKVAAFDVRHWRWKTLPNAKYDPVALPDGLASIGLQCGPNEDSNARCHVEVSTLRWGDRHWHNQQVSKRAVWVHEGGFVETIAVRGGWAYFHAVRERTRLTVRVRVDGTVQKMPEAPAEAERLRAVKYISQKVCATARGLQLVRWQHPEESEVTGNSFTPYGPVQELDVRRSPLRWRAASTATPLPSPNDGVFVCGSRGIVLLQPNRASEWRKDRFVPIAAAPTPKVAVGAPDSVAAQTLANRALVLSGGFRLWQLRDGTWTNPAIPEAGLPWTTVGNLIAYEAMNATTRATELRVVP